jgi:hypothetical protein
MKNSVFKNWFSTTVIIEEHNGSSEATANPAISIAHMITPLLTGADLIFRFRRICITS